MFSCCFKPRVYVVRDVECQANISVQTWDVGCGTEQLTRDASTQVDDKKMVLDELDAQINRLRVMRKVVEEDHTLSTRYYNLD